MGAKFSARECIPIEYIEEQMREYAKFDHLRANAEFLNWFVKDYKDNAMADYECEADIPQTEKAGRIPFDPLVEMDIKRMVEERLRQTKERSDQ